MKKKTMLKYMLPFLAVFVAFTAWFGAKQAAGAVQRLEEIEAYYVGEAVEVGKEISLKDFFLNATYYIYNGQSGYDDYVEVKSGFTITPSVIRNKGDNRITVTYKGKSCTVLVPGKAVESISAEYLGDELYVGTAIPLGKVEVYVNFTDGSYDKIRDFTLSQPTVTKEGLNSITVSYQGKTDEIIVYGKAPLAVEYITADYDYSKTVIAGNAINKSDIEVWVTYNDGSEPKKVTNFNISPSIAKYEGENTITVSYGGAECEITVYAEPREIEEMRVSYKGPGVIVGNKIPREDIEVIVSYNDGSEEAIENFELYGETILYEGENLVLVYYDAFWQDITVMGVLGFAANYDNPISNYFFTADMYYSTKVTLGMGMGLQKNKFYLRSADQQQVKSLVQRVASTDKFIGFELSYEDDEMVTEFPMAMKVTVPNGFDPEKFGVYYIPGQTTVMAKVDGAFLDEKQTEYEFVVYEPGTYILIEEISNRPVTEIIVESKVTLKENRSYSLNPVVFPLSAENKELSYWSTDEAVATVSSNGKVSAHSEGTCAIRIEAQDGSGVFAVVTVEVRKNGK